MSNTIPHRMTYVKPTTATVYPGTENRFPAATPDTGSTTITIDLSQRHFSRDGLAKQPGANRIFTVTVPGVPKSFHWPEAQVMGTMSTSSYERKAIIEALRWDSPLLRETRPEFTPTSRTSSRCVHDGTGVTTTREPTGGVSSGVSCEDAVYQSAFAEGTETSVHDGSGPTWNYGSGTNLTNLELRGVKRTITVRAPGAAERGDMTTMPPSSSPPPAESAQDGTGLSHPGLPPEPLPMEWVRDSLSHLEPGRETDKDAIEFREMARAWVAARGDTDGRPELVSSLGMHSQEPRKEIETYVPSPACDVALHAAGVPPSSAVSVGSLLPDELPDPMPLGPQPTSDTPGMPDLPTFVRPSRSDKDLFDRPQFDSGRKATALGVAGIATMAAALVTGLMPIILRQKSNVGDVGDADLQELPPSLEEPDYKEIREEAGGAWLSTLDPDSTLLDDEGNLTDKGKAQLDAVETAAEEIARAEYAVAYAEWENECATINASNEQALVDHEEQLAAHAAALARAEPQHVGLFAGVAAAAGVAGGLMTGVGFMKGHSISQNPAHPNATVTSTGQSTDDASQTSKATPSPS